MPVRGHRIGIEELRNQSTIVFSWSSVPGANAYIFTLHQITDSGRRQIVARPPETRTGWTLDDIGILNSGTFVWQVEAVSRNRDGIIERRGRPGEHSFILDVPRPGPVQLDDPGIFYVP